MKLTKALLLAATLLLAPAAALAGDLPPPVGDFDDVEQPIPEPSGALIMGMALAGTALVLRRRK